MMLANEFAAVDVELDDTANGVRLRVVDLLRGDRAVYLDPMLLEALVWADPDELVRLTEPDRIIASVERAADRKGRP
jgi:hypothetical protein